MTLLPSPSVGALAAQALPQPPTKPDALKEAAMRLEAGFLAEMLKSAGLDKPREGLGGGGTGESQFGSFLVQAQAEQIARSGGIGLAETLYQALVEREHDQ